ncbi:hypothetical protein VTH06DRAFT_1947 [Thermothelomyces fergusii]
MSLRMPPGEHRKTPNGLQPTKAHYGGCRNPASSENLRSSTVARPRRAPRVSMPSKRPTNFQEQFETCSPAGQHHERLNEGHLPA